MEHNVEALLQIVRDRLSATELPILEDPEIAKKLVEMELCTARLIACHSKEELRAFGLTPGAAAALKIACTGTTTTHRFVQLP